MRALAVLAVAGCYRPSIENCQYSCATGDTCPDGFVCDQGMCVGSIGEACAPHLDGGPMQDGLIGEAGCAWSYPVSNVNPCQFSGITGDWLVLTNHTTMIDTNTGTITGDAPPAGSIHTAKLANNLDVMVVYVGQFDLGRDATFLVTGFRPLIILADDRAGIDGVIDFSAQEAGPCGTMGSGTKGDLGSMSGGGGGGGSLGIVTIFSDGAGANGGDGGTGTQKGFSGNPIADTFLAPLVLGCSGGFGGDAGGTGGGGGAGGAGGGAIQISTRSTIEILGQLRASGGGGGSSPGSGGGGGGGSGGAVLLEAMMTTLQTTSALCANGGGGGASGTAVKGELGHCDLTVAHGAGTSGNPGSGGDGETATSSSVVGQPGSGAMGGGGGGGGVGIIHVNGNVSIAGVQSPHLTQ